MKWTGYFLSLVIMTGTSLAANTAYFKKNDTDANGSIDKSEFYGVIKTQLEKEGKSFSAQVAEQRFFNRDKDQNGVLSDEEFSGKAEHNKKWGYFKKSDSNSDGFVSKDEFTALTKAQLAKEGNTDYNDEATKRFKKRDINQDGKLSVQEFFLLHTKSKVASPNKIQ